MRALAAWLPVLLLVFGGYAFVTDRAMSQDPQRVLVIVDSSFLMSQVWGQVPQAVDALDGQRYTEYALATEKQLIHSWRAELDLDGDVTPFAPCVFDTVDELAEVQQANRVVVVTTGNSCAASAVPDDWQIVTP